MKTVNDPLVTLGLLERGAFKHEIGAKLQEALKTLKDQSRLTKKAKGSLTLKLDLTVEDGEVEIRGEVTTKTPKLPRGKTTMFVTDEGALSSEHPQQTSIMDRLEEVEDKKVA